jgi:hypothetical protein
MPIARLSPVQAGYMLLAACVLLALPAKSSAQSDGETLRIPLGVYSGTGELLLGVHAENLRIRGVRGRVRAVTLDAQPRRILLLIDASGSVLGHPQLLGQFQGIASALVDRAGPDDFIALHSFASQLEMHHPFTNEHASLAKSIENLEVEIRAARERGLGQSTRAHKALAAILEQHADTLRPGDVIVMFSDAAAHPVDAGLQRRVREALVRARIRLLLVFRVDEIPFRRPPPVEAQAMSDLYDLVLASGGMALDLRDPSWTGQRKNLPAAERTVSLANTLEVIVRGFYWIEIDLAEELSRPRRIRIELYGEDGKRWSGFHLSYPARVYPSAP